MICMITRRSLRSSLHPRYDATHALDLACPPVRSSRLSEPMHGGALSRSKALDAPTSSSKGVSARRRVCYVQRPGRISLKSETDDALRHFDPCLVWNWAPRADRLDLDCLLARSSREAQRSQLCWLLSSQPSLLSALLGHGLRREGSQPTLELLRGGPLHRGTWCGNRDEGAEQCAECLEYEVALEDLG